MKPGDLVIIEQKVGLPGPRIPQITSELGIFLREINVDLSLESSDSDHRITGTSVDLVEVIDCAGRVKRILPSAVKKVD